MQSYSYVALVTLLSALVYFLGYVKDAKKRFPGFFIQSVAAFALLLGALGRIVYLMAEGTIAS